MRKKVILVAAVATAVLAGAVAVAGTVRTTHVLTVTRTTSATSEAVWQQWKDVPNRTQWDQRSQAQGTTTEALRNLRGPTSDHLRRPVLPSSRRRDGLVPLSGRRWR
jgi:hypothetical protein